MRHSRRAIPRPVERSTRTGAPRCPLCGVALEPGDVVFTSVSCWSPACANFDARRYPALAGLRDEAGGGQ